MIRFNRISVAILIKDFRIIYCGLIHHYFPFQRIIMLIGCWADGYCFSKGMGAVKIPFNGRITGLYSMALEFNLNKLVGRKKEM